MSTNTTTPTNPNPEEDETYKRWSRINYYDLDQWYERGGISLDYLRWAINRHGVRNRDNPWLRWILHSENRAKLESLPGDLPAFLRELFYHGPYGQALVSFAGRAHLSPFVLLFTMEEIEAIFRKVMATTGTGWDWLGELVKIGFDRQKVMEIGKRIVLNGADCLSRFLANRSDGWHYQQMDAEVKAMIVEIAEFVLPVAVDRCLACRPRGKNLNEKSKENIEVAAIILVHYPEAPNREALQNWLMRQFDKDNAAKLHLMLQHYGRRNNELGEALKKRVIECGWVFGKIKRTVVMEYEDGRTIRFESSRAKWRSDSEEAELWEVLIRADKLGKDITKIPESWCVSVRKPR